MKSQLRFPILTALVAVLALLGSAAPALAAGLSVNPTLGGYDTTFNVTSSGFGANERVATWVTLSDGRSIALPEVQADSAGNLAFSITPQAGWAQGEIIAVAHGISTQREYFSKFTLAAPVSEGDNNSDSDVMRYIGHSTGRTLTYQGWGYVPGERVATWYHLPGDIPAGVAHPLPDVFADAGGNVSFPFTVQSGWPYGGYHISAEGTASQHTTYNTFSWFGTITDQRAYVVNGDGVSPPTPTPTPPPTITGQWTGYYYPNVSLSGPPVMTRVDPSLNFNWGTGSPTGAIPVDNFSVRWLSTQNVSVGGNFVITGTSDDGVRVWVDGNLVIDGWVDQSAMTYNTVVFLGAGNHTIQVDYYERSGGAMISVGIAAQ